MNNQSGIKMTIKYLFH